MKPECEKSRWEKFKDGCKKVGEWCKEHWKEIVIVIGTVLIITAIVITGFTSLVPLLTFLGLSVKLATVVSVTVCGIAFLASNIYLLGYPLNILGKIFKSDTLKTISFGLRHPIISLQIGKLILEWEILILVQMPLVLQMHLILKIMMLKKDQK